MNYQQNVSINADTSSVFKALTEQLELWWGKTDFPVQKVNDEFTIWFGDAFWKFRIEEFIPDQKLTWKCIDGQPEFNNEWVGTTCFWEIKPNESETELSFTHDGLTPEFKCYDICAPTWDMFITQSIKSFLEIGKGTPHFH